MGGGWHYGFVLHFVSSLYQKKLAVAKTIIRVLTDEKISVPFDSCILGLLKMVMTKGVLSGTAGNKKSSATRKRGWMVKTLTTYHESNPSIRS